jgi:L-asparaginase
MKIFPGFSHEVYKSFFDFSKVKGIVIESFGAGNIPTNNEFMMLVENFIQEGGLVLNITQCNTGSVIQGKYETSSIFQKIGVVGGNDLTTEAAVTKMMYVLGKYKNTQTAKKILSENICGEMNVN